MLDNVTFIWPLWKMYVPICSLVIWQETREVFKALTLSPLFTKQEAFVDSIAQDQTVRNVQSDRWSTLSIFILQWKCILANEKARFIYSVMTKLR